MAYGAVEAGAEIILLIFLLGIGFVIFMIYDHYRKVYNRKMAQNAQENDKEKG